MDEQFVNRIADAVYEKLQAKPRALCIGDPPGGAFPFLPVSQPPYEAVVLASLSLAQLLAMPSDPVCRALLEGMPVYLCPEGLEYKKYASSSARGLYAMLQGKERQLRNMGVQLLKNAAEPQLLTAQEIRKRKAQGLSLPPGARLTPLARDIWEGKG